MTVNHTGFGRHPQQLDLAAEHALRGAGFNVTLQLRPGDGHFCDSDFVEHSWRVLTGNRIAALK